MVMDNLEHIRLLILNELEDSLSDEDRVILTNAVQNNPDIAAMREHMHAVLNVAEVKTAIDSEATVASADRLLSSLKKRNNPAKIIAIGIAVAAAAAVAILLLMPQAYKHNNPTPSYTTNTIQLKLNNGQVIDLGKDTNQVIGSVKLNSSSKMLHYEDNSHASNQYAVLSVPSGKDYSILLSDGSRVQLNSGTTLRFPLSFSGKTREIYMSGEMYINVAANATKPFFVHLPNGDIRVLGTSFNVNTYDSGEAKIALIDGKVSVKNKKDSIQLQPGQQGILSANDLQINTFDAYETLSWREGRFIFNNARLEDVCKVIPRWFGTMLVLDNKNVADKRFTGTLDRTQPLEVFLKGLRATNGIDYSTDQQQVIHIK
jgi:transmembrane sensor